MSSYTEKYSLTSIIVGLIRRTDDRAQILAALTGRRLAQEEIPRLIVGKVLSAAPWTGTAASFLLMTGCPQIGTACLSRHLRRLAPVLASAGVEISFRREGGTGRRMINIRRDGG
jgi:hypothetical protein